MQIEPYLLFDGDCEAAIKFYEKVLGGKIEAMMTHEGTEAAAHVPPEWGKKILHACLIVDGQRIMASDAPPGHFQKPQGFSVCLNIEKPADGDRIFKALSENGTVTMPFAQTFWAYRFGMCTDRYGTPWMINCEKAA